MMLHLTDGTAINALAVSSYDMLITAVVRLDMLDRDSLIWMRSALSQAVDGNGSCDEILEATIRLTNRLLEEMEAA